MTNLYVRDVWAARNRISSIVKKTPLLFSEELSKITGSSIYLKLENLNTTTSFKIRGAANKILSLTEEEKRLGITTFSTGNFGLSVAYVAQKLGIRAVICISRNVPKAKIDALKNSGAEVVEVGETQNDTEKRSYELEKEERFTVIHPFDDGEVIAGQGTIGLEILEELPETDTVLAGLSGGGLHSGLGLALKETNPELRLIGLSAANGAAMYESIQAGEPVITKEKNTLADSLLGGIGLENQYTFRMVQQYVDDILLLDEEAFASGMVFMLEKHHMLIEGAAAAGIGAILQNKVALGNRVVIVISGSSVDMPVILKLLEEDR